MANVYLWKMEGGNVGHLSIQLENGKYISFWPGGNIKDKKSGFSHTFKDSLQDDIKAEGRSPHEQLAIPAAYINVPSISEYIDEQEKSGRWQNYNILWNNCGQVVFKLLKQSNTNNLFPDLMDPARWNELTPTAIFNKIKLAVERSSHMPADYNMQEAMAQSQAIGEDDYPYVPPVPEHLRPTMKFWPFT